MIMVPGIPRDSSPFSVSLSIVCSSGRSTRLMQTIIGPISPLQCGLSQTTNALLEKLQITVTYREQLGQSKAKKYGSIQARADLCTSHSPVL